MLGVDYGKEQEEVADQSGDGCRCPWRRGWELGLRWEWGEGLGLEYVLMVADWICRWIRVERKEE